MTTDHRWPLIALLILVALLLIGPLMMGPSVMGPGMMGGSGPQNVQPNTPGWMWGLGMGFGWLAMLCF